MPGTPGIPGLQDEIVKYIDRMITIMGLNAKPLVCQMVPYFLQQVQDINGDQVEKMNGILNMLSNYLGQVKEHSLDIIDGAFSDIWVKFEQIPVPNTNTAEIDKIRIGVAFNFYRLYQRTVTDFTSSFLISGNNFKHLNNFLVITLNHLRDGCDFKTKKLV